MVQTIKEQNIQELKRRIAALYKHFLDNKDLETAEKTRQLAGKVFEKEYAIAFCGHFSAGKSSMINRLIGEDLLPSSPIPTSANLVKVKSGEEYAKVFFKEGKPRLYPAPYNYEKVKTYCKDGDQIQSIEISHDTKSLPKEAVILDTPGIDSTDDAHRIATESALHLADLVFYVMDYNHVQSELNFLFTKELTEAGKEVYLIINQIDKHREEELTFEQFKASVTDSFASWGVKPAKVFYTSLKDEHHIHNQFRELKEFIHSTLNMKDQLLPLSVYHSLRKLTDEHTAFLNLKDQEQLDHLTDLLSPTPLTEQKEIPTKLKGVREQQAELKTSVEQAEGEFQAGIEAILKNAYLMPFQTRELAKSYLESRQPDFKVGLLFAKQKTEQERNTRLDRFFSDVQEKATSQLDWHLKDFCQKILKNHQIHDPALLAEVQGYRILLEKRFLESIVKPGARLSGEYVLHYTNDVVEAVKKIARDKMNSIKFEFLRLLTSQQKQHSLSLETEEQKLKVLAEALQERELILENQTAQRIKMEQYLTEDVDIGGEESFLKELLEQDSEVEKIFDDDEYETTENNSPKSESKIEEFKEEMAAEKETSSTEDMVRKLKYTARQIESVPGFNKITKELLQKADRIENKGFTVALFGAFSAGKSSFANALIGEKLLPVSPNPTTAAINKIMPVDSENEHGTVKVKLKEQEFLFADVLRSLAVFDLSANSFDDAIKQIAKVIENSVDFDSHEKTHYAFLHAFFKGFETYRNQLGETLFTDLQEFKEFVAKEEKSCLVESIEVYFDCALTRKGITLVDTPGADSINARHTGVAFEYIKNSDAILFVTYYNHAFSKADREFLIQLGRVKDTFELDKMFFVVNAIDLASDQEELNAVLDYVGDQLIKYGIRKPNLFPVSSLLGLKEKLDPSANYQSRLQKFEEAFYSFITHDLMDITVDTAKADLQRAMELLRNYIETSQEDKDVKARKREALIAEQKQLEEIIQKSEPGILIQRLGQESDELTYYIKQRVFYRFNDFFKESFNPAVLKDDGRNMKKALQHALDDFLSSLGYDFSQELRATTLRLEACMKQLIFQSQQSISQNMAQINNEISPSPFETGKIAGLEFESAFTSISRDLFSKAMSYFKNPKAFFEKNEKKFMADELERVLNGPAETYLLEGNNRLKEHYETQLRIQFEALSAHLLEETREYYKGMFAALSDEISIDTLIEIENRMIHFS